MAVDCNYLFGAAYQQLHVDWEQQRLPGVTNVYVLLYFPDGAGAAPMDTCSTDITGDRRRGIVSPPRPPHGRHTARTAALGGSPEPRYAGGKGGEGCQLTAASSSPFPIGADSQLAVTVLCCVCVIKGQGHTQ
jgi:hypothetical protein